MEKKAKKFIVTAEDGKEEMLQRALSKMNYVTKVEEADD